MPAYWVKFKDGKGGCVEGTNAADATAEAESLGEVVSLKVLPYPANPRLSKVQSDCPAFCFTPHLCAGKSSCPKSYACSE